MSEVKDELIGKFFHSWDVPTMQTGSQMEGQVVGRQNDAPAVYLLELFGTGLTLMRVDLMSNWKFFDSLENLESALSRHPVAKYLLSIKEEDNAGT